MAGALASHHLSHYAEHVRILVVIAIRSQRNYRTAPDHKYLNLKSDGSDGSDGSNGSNGSDGDRGRNHLPSVS